MNVDTVWDYITRILFLIVSFSSGLVSLIAKLTS